MLMGDLPLPSSPLQTLSALAFRGVERKKSVAALKSSSSPPPLRFALVGAIYFPVE